MSKTSSSRFFEHGTYRSQVPGRSVETDIYQPRFRNVSPGTGSVRLSADERLDVLSYQHFGDPFGFWRWADANRVYEPRSILTAGRVLRRPGRGS